MGSSLPTCLTIAGSDSSGGAGIQADLKTFAAHGVYGMSAITAVTAQNTLGVQNIDVLSAKSVSQQIESVLDDIPADAIKIGMLSNTEIIKEVAKALIKYQSSNVVIDPVMISTSGSQLVDTDAIHTLIEELIPCADLITPNISELMTLCEILEIKTSVKEIDLSDFEQLSYRVFDALPKKHNGERIAFLGKGGHLELSNKSNDLLIDSNRNAFWFAADRVETQNSHGTGCTLSAAICANLANGEQLARSCSNAKEYVYRVLKYDLDLGRGNGPLNHLA